MTRTPFDPAADPDKTAFHLKIIWGFTIFGDLVVAGFVSLLMIQPDDSLRMIDLPTTTAIIAVAAAGLLLIPLAYFIRNQIYKKHWVGNAVTPAGYFNATIMFHALIDALVMISVFGAFVIQQTEPLFAGAGMAILAHLINFPDGRPMRPTPPRLGVSER